MKKKKHIPARARAQSKNQEAGVKTIFISPRAPLVLRSGKAFGTVGAAGGDTLAFPLPGTLAGALRGARGEQLKVDFAQPDSHAVTALKDIAVRGPFLASLGRNGDLALYFPRPLDAAYLAHDDPEQQLQPLAPCAPAADEYTDLWQDGLQLPCLPRGAAKSKPVDGPRFWEAEVMTKWLTDPESVLKTWLTQLGVEGPPIDVRTHVVVDTGSQHARDGGLYQSAGLDFGPSRRDDGGWYDDHLGVAAVVSQPVEPGYVRFGGEGRLSHIVGGRSDSLYNVPSALKSKLEGQKRLRLILATPALFDDGWKPGWLDRDGPAGFEDFQLKLVAAAVERAQPVSGWDMTKGARGHKPARRLAPAGSVYWLEIGNAQKDAAALAQALWLKPVSDREDDRRDGHGLAMIGVWKKL